jgi:anaerobic ribonucleoside-triphosphate reductase activating protein
VRSSSKIRVSRVLHGTVAEGPALRTAVWFQGCSIRCVGCINPHLFSFEGGELIDPSDVVETALEHRVEGLTLLGGEPSDQADGAGQLAAAAQEAGLGVVTFTGYRHEDLALRPEARTLLENTDLLIDGPYVRDQPEENRTLVGSANQRFLHLSDRYASYDPRSARNRVEVRIGAQGTTDIAGFLPEARLRDLVSGLSGMREQRSRRHLREGK